MSTQRSLAEVAAANPDGNIGKTQADYYALAERCLPGAGLGGYSLPEEARFIIQRGEGSRVQSVDGRWYIDYCGGAGANILGHCHPAIVEAVQTQASRGMHYFGTLNDIALDLVERLIAAIPCAEQIALTTTGSEATFYAMRMARAYTGKSKILKFEGAYHGNHDYSSFSLFPTEPAAYPTGKADSGGVPPALQSTVLVAPYNDLATVERIVEDNKDDLALIIVEGIQRIIFAEQVFIDGLRQLCDKHGIVLIFDEVVTGFRMALGGAQEYFGVTPDLATYGKIVGGGGPLGCVAGKKAIIDRSNPRHKGQSDYAYINGTLHGNPLAAAAGLATLDIIEQPGFYKTLHARSNQLLTALQVVLDRHNIPAIADGDCSFWQILFMAESPRAQTDMMASDVARMRQLDIELLKRGIYVLPGVRRFVAAANTDEDFSMTVDALDAACQATR